MSLSKQTALINIDFINDLVHPDTKFSPQLAQKVKERNV